MLQIKNTLGGGKPEGLYVWKKYEIGSELKEINESVSTLPYSFYNGCAVVLNGEIHILGGSGGNTNHYKWDGSSWTSVSTLPYSFSYGSAVVLNGEIHILGGSDSSTKHYKFDGTSWTSVSTLPYGFYDGSAVVFDNEIHILGGSDSSTKHYKFDGTSWTSVSTLPYGFYDGSAVVYNNEIHILGSSANSTYYKYHYKWNGTSWTSVSTLPYGFRRSSAVVFENEIHILGTDNSGTYFKAHYKWDGTSWTSVSTLPYDFYQGSAVVLNGGIHILGSSNSSYRTAHYLIIGYAPTYTFLDYIVSDKETAYPDGGEKGGYWYERAKDIDLLTAGGYTKIAVDKFTFSSATSITNVISHSLGEIPLFYLIVADIPSASKNDFLGAFYFKPKFQSTKADGVYYYAYGDNTYSTPSVGELKTLTDSSISIFNNSTYKYKAGVEYTLITMA